MQPLLPSTRRDFIGRSVLAGSGLCLSAVPGCAPRPEDSGDPGLIDVHQHVNYHGRSDDGLLEHQHILGATLTVLLPAGTRGRRSSTHAGASNGLAARIFGTEAAWRLSKRYPDRYRFFANEIPDFRDAQRELERWLKRGAVGIGEQKFNVDCDSAGMMRIAEVAQFWDVPVLLHFEHGAYNHGFERFHRVLERFPDVRFIGHAQTWWGHIDRDHRPETLYPKGPVTPGGLTDRYLSDYPNLFGDLSAGSGLNALTRDEDHAADFLKRHQDKLLYGSDCADASGAGPECSGAATLEVARRLLPDSGAIEKILWRNAVRVIRL
ncbi:MAG TPA: amidohydrolase family protein [Verrucomicrobiales bacterium]|nr:amidohydrolase family protein [Verrucomicrobiales bacterium]